MAVVFRKLHEKRHWDSKPWLGSSDAQGDTVRCLTTKGSKLSVFVLENPATQMERVVAALALTRDSVKHFDLATIPEDVLDLCGIQRVSAQATTPDPEVNGWHYDLIELTIAKIAQLAASIRSQGTIRRYQPREVKEAIQNSLLAGAVTASDINRSMVESMERKGIRLP